MKRNNNLQCIKETRRIRFLNNIKESVQKNNLGGGTICGTVNPFLTTNIPLSRFGYILISCYNDNQSSNASGIVSPVSVQMTINSTNPYKAVPGINVYISTIPIVQIINQSDSIVNYSISILNC